MGQPISGTGLPAGTYITSILSSSSFTVSNNATATATNRTYTLGVANSYSGPTTISGGVLRTSNLYNLGGWSGIGRGLVTFDVNGLPVNDPVTNAASLVLDGGTLRYDGAAVTINRLFTLTTTAGSALDASGTGALILSNTGAMGFGISTGARSLTLTGVSTASNTLAALIGDQGGNATSLIKKGAGTWVLSGTSTYTGTTSIESGILSVSSIGNFGGGASNLGNPTSGAINIGNLTTTGTLLYTGTTVSTNRTINLAGASGGAMIDSSGTGAITFTAPAFTATGVGPKTLTLKGSNTGANTLASIVPDGAGSTPVSLVKSGPGTWVLEASGVNATGNITTLSTKSVTGINTANLSVGMVVRGPGIVDGTRITAIPTPGASGTITLSEAAIATGTGVGLSFGIPASSTSTITGNIGPGSYIINNVDTTNLAVGQAVYGPGIAQGTTIAAITTPGVNGEVTLSQAAVTPAPVVSGLVSVASSSTAAPLVTLSGASTLLAVGSQFLGRTVTDVAGTTITLSGACEPDDLCRDSNWLYHSARGYGDLRFGQRHFQQPLEPHGDARQRNAESGHRIPVPRPNGHQHLRDNGHPVWRRQPGDLFRDFDSFYHAPLGHCQRLDQQHRKLHRDPWHFGTATVASSSTSSAIVTLDSPSTTLVSGAQFLGQTVLRIVGTTVTLPGNANQTIGSATPVNFTLASPSATLVNGSLLLGRTVTNIVGNVVTLSGIANQTITSPAIPIGYSVSGSGAGVRFVTGNTYTGSTTVSSGILQVGVNGIGSTGMGVTTVAAGATLAGSGIINGTVGTGAGTTGTNHVVNGTLRPGDNIGSALGGLTFNGNLTLSSSSTTFLQFSAPTLNDAGIVTSLLADTYNTTGGYRDNNVGYWDAALVSGTQTRFHHGCRPADPELAEQQQRHHHDRGQSAQQLHRQCPSRRRLRLWRLAWV